MRRPAPLRSGPALGSFYPSRTAQIGTVLHSDLTVRHQFLGGDGGVTVRPRSCHTLFLSPSGAPIVLPLVYQRRKVNVNQVFAGQKVGVKQTDEHIWLVTFMDYDLGYFDDETGRLEPIDNPFGSKLLSMSPE